MYDFSLRTNFLLFLFFIVVTLIMGILYGRGVKTAQAYAVGNKRYGTVTLAMTIVATWISSPVFVEELSYLYTGGLYGVLRLLLISLAVPVFGYLLLGAGEFLSKRSAAEALGSVYGQQVAWPIALIASAFSVGIVAVQLRIGALTLQHLFGLSIMQGLLLLCIIVSLYAAIGGVRAVIFTDMLQLVILAIFLPIVILVLLMGLTRISVNTHLPEAAHSVFTLPSNVSKPSFISHVCISILFYTMAPPIFQRVQMARNVYQSKKSFLYAGIIWFVISLFLIGISILLRAENINSFPTDVLPHLLAKFETVGLSSFAAIGFLAMTLSTADSYLNTGAVLLLNDFKESKATLIGGRVATLGLGCIAFAVAITTSTTTTILHIARGFVLAIVIPTLALMLLGFRSSKRVIAMGMLAGLVAAGVSLLRCWGSEFSELQLAIPGLLAHVGTLFLLHYLLREEGGWVGVVEWGPLQQEWVLARERWRVFRRDMAKFSWHEYLAAEQLEGMGMGWYILLGIYSMSVNLTGYGILVLSNPAIRSNFYISALLVSVVVWSGVLLTYPFWPVFSRKRTLAIYAFPLIVGYLLFFCTPALFFLSKGNLAFLVASLSNLVMGIWLFAPPLLWCIATFFGILAYQLVPGEKLYILTMKQGVGSLVLISIGTLSCFLLLFYYRRGRQKADKIIARLLVSQRKNKSRYAWLRAQCELVHREFRAFEKAAEVQREQLLGDISKEVIKVLPEGKAQKKLLAQHDLLSQHIAHSAQHAVAKMDRLQEKMLMQYKSVRVEKLLRTLADHVALLPNMPVLVFEDTALNSATIVCDHDRIQTLFLSILELLPAGRDEIIYIQAYATALSVPTPNAPKEPAIAFTIQKGLGKDVITNHIQPLYLRQGQHLSLTDIATVRTITAHGGYLAQDSSRRALFLVLPQEHRRYASLSEDNPPAVFSSKFSAMSKRVEAAFWQEVRKNDHLQVSRLEQAVAFMKERHAHTTRRNGAPFYTHTLTVAHYVLSYCQREEVVLAAILHDMLDGTTISVGELRIFFSTEVTKIVGMLDTIQNHWKKYALEGRKTHAQLLIAAGNRDAQLIKLCDRLHNMETLQLMPTKKQQEKARETVLEFVPLARRLGYQPLAQRLLTISNKYISDITFPEISEEEKKANPLPEYQL